MSAAKVHRKLHRLGAILVAVPLLVVLCTGLLLQVRKDFEWIQPAEARGLGGPPTLSLDQAFLAARAVHPALETWADVDRMEVRPAQGIVKVRARDRVEVQVDASTGEVLKVAPRRSDLIESLHDGTWFHERARLWGFLPAAAITLGLWVTGVYLWFLPYLKRRRKRQDIFG